MSSTKKPVLLIHGIGDTGLVFSKMTTYLRDRGWSEIHTLDLVPCNGDLGLDELASQIKDYVDLYLAAADQIDLVAFSMGGIVSRYYLQRLGGLSKVRHFVTLASPHNGTWTGYFRQNLGVRQMRPNSPLLEDLNQSLDDLAQVNFVSLWTPYDLMIVPANSSYLPVGTMMQLPVLAHPFMLTDPRSLNVVAQILRGQPLPQQVAI